MKIFSLNKWLLLSILYLITHTLYGAQIQCWINSDGITECGNYVPPHYSQKGFTEYNEQGIKIREIAAALTAEEIAEKERQREEKRRRQEQLKKDRALVDIFGTERDIELARKAVLTTIDGQIQSLQTIFDGLKRNLKDLEDSFVRSKHHPSVSTRQLIGIRRNINRIKKRITDTKDTLQNMRQERIDTNKEYDAYVQQYREIVERWDGLPPR